jgi:hypothetical protein
VPLELPLENPYLNPGRPSAPADGRGDPDDVGGRHVIVIDLV